MSKYYAVAKGRETGIFTDWNITKEHVNGYPGAIYKSFTSRDSATEYLKGNGLIITPSIAPSIANSPQIIDNILYAYTDGSHSNQYGGVGIVFVKNGNILNKISFGMEEYPTTNNRAELLAIYTVLHNHQRFEYSKMIIYTDSEYSVNAFNKNIYLWEKNGYKTSTGEPVKNLDIILPAWDIIKVNKNIKVEWIKAHDKNEYNNIADELANDGRINMIKNK